MQWQLACTGRKWCDFVSFDPRMPENLQIFVQRVERNDLYIKMLEEEVTLFLAEIEEKVKILRNIKIIVIFNFNSSGISQKRRFL